MGLKYNELECNGPNAVMLKSGEFQADKFQLWGSLSLCRAPVVPCSVWTIGESAVNLQEFGSLSGNKQRKMAGKCTRKIC